MFTPFYDRYPHQARGRSHPPTVIPRRSHVALSPHDRALLAIVLASCEADLRAAMDRALMFTTVPS